jgi:ParB family chromosome partitioning protein
MSKQALGRGLNSLIPQRTPNAPPVENVPPPAGPPTSLPVGRIVPNPFQPRKHFDEHALQELAQSIRTEGVIQPLIVRKAGEVYQLIAGERRWRASQLAGLATVPVHVHEMADARMLEVALVENIQREDLNPIEAAQAFQKLSEDLGLSHEEIGQRTGKDRATVSNFIRLLQLPQDVQALVAEGKLSPGHARALLKLADETRIRDYARQTIKDDWSVRTLEQITTNLLGASWPNAHEQKPLDPNVKAAIEDLERALGTRVRIRERGKQKGWLEIDYSSQDELDRIYGLIVGDE